MSTEESSVYGFDLDDWKKQGEQALKVARENQATLRKDLAEADKQVAKLEEALGMNGKGNGKKRKRIRPTIAEVLLEQLENAGDSIRYRDLFVLVESKIQGVGFDSMVVSAKRFAKASDKYEAGEAEIKYLGSE